jgi:hypothetical protein
MRATELYTRVEVYYPKFRAEQIYGIVTVKNTYIFVYYTCSKLYV